jgi:tRNA (guanine-N7-)-methyltransferase
MRLRKIKGAKETILARPEYVQDIKDARRVNDVEHVVLPDSFDQKKPLHIEIGMGKGQFIHTTAKMHPENNYIGIERFDSVLYRALEKMIDEPLNNLFLLRMDAKYIKAIFKDVKVDCIYLNFSDPWPKVRHEKRRLTHPSFLAQYEQLLNKGGRIEQKTDNQLLYSYSKEQMEEYPMDLLFDSTNLHQESVENIMTEFEEKFSKEGKHIYKLITKFKEDIHG